MHFEHLEEPTRAARIESSNADLVVHFIDSQGKSRKKTFKGKGESTAALASTWLQALRFVVREGFGFGRSDTNPRWLFFQDEPYMGQQPFAYDAASGRVCLTEAQPRVLKWLDAHANTVENIDLAVPSIRGIVARDGVLWLLLAVSGGAEPWQRPVEGGWGANIVRLDGIGPTLFAGASGENDRLLDAISVSETGEVLGPHADGAAVYAPNGDVLETYEVWNTQTNYPRGALSPRGELLALSAASGSVRLVDRRTGDERLVSGFPQVLRLHVTDERGAFIFGYGAKQWGVYRVERDKEPEKVGSDVHAEVSPSGELLLSVKEGSAQIFEVGQPKAIRQWKLPMLIGREGRSCFVDEHTAIVRMRGFTPVVELSLHPR